MRWSKVLNVVECHAGGEIGKVVTGGIGDVPGETMFDKKVYLEQHRDGSTKLALCATPPRGSNSSSLRMSSRCCSR